MADLSISSHPPSRSTARLTALVVNIAVISYFQLYQLTSPLAIIKTYPLVD
jgi:hypothetical protein